MIDRSSKNRSTSSFAAAAVGCCLCYWLSMEIAGGKLKMRAYNGNLRQINHGEPTLWELIDVMKLPPTAAVAAGESGVLLRLLILLLLLLLSLALLQQQQRQIYTSTLRESCQTYRKNDRCQCTVSSISFLSHQFSLVVVAFIYSVLLPVANSKMEKTNRN